MPRDKFLQQVADYYLCSATDLSSLTMVFPNKRSAMFMRKYLKEGMRQVSFMPKLVSVTYFIQQFDSARLAENTELLFALYRAYCRVLRRHGREEQLRDFDSFVFWGSVLLEDYNDVDADMVDAEQLFKNLSGVQEISANYLTEGQIEVARELWGGRDLHYDVERFWNHMPDVQGEATTSAKFLNFWEIMGELHSEFIAELSAGADPIAYSGLQSRRASEAISSMGADDFSGRRYAFVGFNVQPASRVRIFKHLSRLGVADFFWDTASPYLRSDTSATGAGAATFVRELSRSLPSPSGFTLKPVSGQPAVDIISVPSNVGQVKTAVNILRKWVDQGIINPSDLVNTAVVLADEQLLQPLLHSLDPILSPVNITMGISLSATPFASLLSSVISMQLRARRIHGEIHFFYQDVCEVLSHPHISMIAPEESRRVKDEIVRGRQYNVSVAWLIEHCHILYPVFRPVADLRSACDVTAYTLGVVDLLQSALEAGASSDAYEFSILRSYREEIIKISSLADSYGVEMRESTFFALLQRALGRIVVNFSGKPLVGLQIMGISDTRVLDFDNVIMLSMNERVFPQRNFDASLIPPALRAGYGMPTRQRRESADAYRFFRLIGRARNVALLFDSRAVGLSSGEMSRFLLQLKHLYRVDEKSVDLLALSDTQESITVHKTADVIADLRRFRPGGDLRLSASALKTYLSCPLKFYLQYVRQMRGETEVTDYVDDASYGSVLHSVLDKVYEPYRQQLITEVTINTMLSADIESLAARELNAIFYKGRYDANLSRMPGEGKVLAKVIARYVRETLKAEKRLAPYTYVDSEMCNGQVGTWTVGPHTFNFTMSVDRVDRLDAGTLRFTDYKTGSDNIIARDVPALFTDYKNGGIFQVLTYCLAYRDIYGFDGDIVPMIYKIVTVARDGLNEIAFGTDKNNIPLRSFRDVLPEFEPLFAEIIRCIFEESDEHPFIQCADETGCAFCKFARMCRRLPA